MGIRPYLPIPRKSFFRTSRFPGPYDHFFDAFGNPVEGIFSKLPKFYTDLLRPRPPPNRNWEVPRNPNHIVPKGANKPWIEKTYKQELSPIPVFFPKRSRKELWGGEGLIFGFRQRDRYERPHRTIWHPKLVHWTCYSEILDRSYETIVSDTTLDLIDENEGFDFYILKTPPHELLSDFAMTIKGDILKALAKESYWLNDSKQFELIKEKYKDYVMPYEQAEWYGLKPEEAILKYQLSQNFDYRPLKEVFADEDANGDLTSGINFNQTLMKNYDAKKENASLVTKFRKFFRV